MVPLDAESVPIALTQVKQAAMCRLIEKGSDAADQSCERLRHALSWQNANTNVRRLKQGGRAPAETLLAAASAAEPMCW